MLSPSSCTGLWRLYFEGHEWDEAFGTSGLNAVGSVGSEHIRLWPQEGGKAVLLLSVSAADMA